MPAPEKSVPVVFRLAVYFVFKLLLCGLFEHILVLVCPLFHSVPVKFTLFQAFQPLSLPLCLHQFLSPELLFQLDLLFQCVLFLSFVIVVRLVKRLENAPQFVFAFPQCTFVELGRLHIYLLLLHDVLLVQVCFLELNLLLLLVKDFLGAHLQLNHLFPLYEFGFF